MADHKEVEECLEYLDAMEIGFNLSFYLPMVEESPENQEIT
ncbi:hypothetical protein [Vibrio sinus]|nr:hypothetical protein [Vibrio sinus]